MRRRTSRRRDRQIFRRSRNSVKKVNIQPNLMRGGIRF